MLQCAPKAKMKVIIIKLALLKSEFIYFDYLKILSWNFGKKGLVVGAMNAFLKGESF